MSVALLAFAFALPTFNLGFWKSFFFSFFALADLPIIYVNDVALTVVKSIEGVFRAVQHSEPFFEVAKRAK